MRNTYSIGTFLLSAILLLTACSEPAPQAIPDKEQLELSGLTMGPIVYTVKLIGHKERVEKLQLAQKVDDLLVKINAQMSTYDPNSELSKFNQYQGLESRKVSLELNQVLTESIRLGQLTQGALDVTVGPLVNLWSFGPEKRPEQVPSPELISQTKANIGIDSIELAQGHLSKRKPTIYIDLSAIAKGFAVDKVADLLEQHGIYDYLVDIGGELRINGKKTDGTDWRIAVEKPIAGVRGVQQVIIPGNNAVATSGDYRNYFEENGVRYSHTINPKTGWPINHRLVSVTVVHPSAMTADGLATAIEVMGPEKGLAFAQANAFAVYLISKTDDGFDFAATEQFNQYLAN
ncbi:FAD:protein FMN transferase [Thalassotalea aquiviva]|uniref:FAD:protein FMN transferase n=1 Tax=Thalassotalea aquiviva TaxID=3242415 RepID=UPI00352B4B8D